MTNFSHYPLQAALYQVLTSDTTLMALLTGIYDRPPQGTPFPYVTIGECAGSDWSSKTTTGMEYTAALHVWSREGGRKESALIMERIHTLLHQASFGVTGQTLVMIRFMSSDIALMDDGWTYEGTMHFHLLLQAN